MEKFALAKSLSSKAENFMSEGNYEYAARCYEKVVGVLRELVGEATSKETIEQLRNKVAKFQALRAEAEAKGKLKMNQAVKPPGFGFPVPNSLSALRGLDPPALKAPQSQEIHIKCVEPERKKAGLRNKRGEGGEGEEEAVVAEAMVRQLDVGFGDIVGLEEVKAVLEEAVIRPRQRPDLYTGIRAPPRGILLYGPPGNGKTLICKALARESGCTFFALSASSILNKLVGESEKTIKKIFAAAERLAPSIIFIDEIDSMLTARSENENEASRRLKTEFLVLMDGVNAPKSGEVLVIGATNLPKELDAAAKRRFSKMVYLPPPDADTRRQLLLRSLQEVDYELSKAELGKVVDRLEFFSASEIRNIIAEACMTPLRELEKSKFEKIQRKDLRKVNAKDLLAVIADRKPIVSKEQLALYKEKV